MNVFTIVSSLVFLFLFNSVLQAYQPKELLFNSISLVEREKRLDGKTSTVVRLRGVEQFGKRVLKSNMPVVVKVWAQKGTMFEKDQVSFHDVADTYKGAVSFVSLGISENEDVVRFIMTKLKLKEVSLPVYLFFKDGVLFLPLVSGFVSKNELSKIVQNKFNFTESKKIETKKPDDRKIVPVDTKKSIYEKEKDGWVDKVKKMLLGIRELSREAQVHRIRTKWARERGGRHTAL